MSDSGYKGRIAIFELLMVDDDIRQLIMQNVASSTIKKMAISKGMITLRRMTPQGNAGITSIDEVLRTTQDDMDDIEESRVFACLRIQSAQ